MSIAADRILYQDEHLLAVNKRVAELVVRGQGAVGKKPLLDYLKPAYPGLRAVHRLDFLTSGVVLFAKTKIAEEAILSKKFDQWQKTYHALVMGRINRQTGVIRAPLPARGRGTVAAESRYTVLDRFGNSTYIEVAITTGRHHQIRRHFAGINHPLVLDRDYGHPKFNQLFRQELGYSKFFLHALRLVLPHPMTGKPLAIEAPLPAAFSECLERLRNL